MSINKIGIGGEKKAREVLLRFGYKNHQQLDWLVKDQDRYFIVEVKQKELFQPPPFTGTGLDIKQLRLRKQLLADLNIDTLLLVFTANGTYYEYLSYLETTTYYDTRNGIRIYDINNFKRLNK